MSILETNKALIPALFAAIWSGDDVAIRAILSEDFVDHAGPPGLPPGPEPTVAWARGMRAVFPDMQVTIEQSVAEGDRVVVYARWRGTHEAPFQGIAATHKVVAFTGMVLWRIVDGKISERWAVIDLGAAMQKLRD